jgi:hypothetical protein
MHTRPIDKAVELKIRVAALQRQKERLRRIVESDTSLPDLRLQARADLERVRAEISKFNIEILRLATGSSEAS